MKLHKKSNTYRASNVSYDPEQCFAQSYEWWTFVKKIDGKIVFNEFPYSNTTRMHQIKVKTLMETLGHRIDLYVRSPDGLHKFKSLSDAFEANRKQERAEADEAERKRIERNRKANARRKALKTTAI